MIGPEDTEAAAGGEDGDWEDGLERGEPVPVLEPKAARRSKRQKKALEAAAVVYGKDLVRALGLIRDPKDRIVFVAESVFARKGYAGARTQEIADLAGVNKAMIHYYFDKKEKLYHAVLDKILFDLIKLTQESVRDRASTEQQLCSFFRGFFDYAATHKNFARLTSMEMGSTDKYLTRMIETFFKPLFDRGVAFIEKGITEGAFKKVDARQYLVSVYGMTISYFADAEFLGMLLGGDPMDTKRLRERREMLLKLICAGLGCKPA